MALDNMVRRHFSSQIVISLAGAIAFYLSPGCSVQEQAQKASLGQYCMSDSACEGQFVCENQQCVSGKGGYCLKDGNCSGVYICQNNKCISSDNTVNNNNNNRNNTLNNNTSSPSVAKTPPEAYSSFKEALSHNDHATALKYISPHVQNKYTEFFSKINLTELAQELPSLPGVNPSYQSPASHFVEYNVQKGNAEFPIIFQCDNHGACTISGF